MPGVVIGVDLTTLVGFGVSPQNCMCMYTTLYIPFVDCNAEKNEEHVVARERVRFHSPWSTMGRLVVRGIPKSISGVQHCSFDCNDYAECKVQKLSISNSDECCIRDIPINRGQNILERHSLLSQSSCSSTDDKIPRYDTDKVHCYARQRMKTNARRKVNKFFHVHFTN